MQCFTCCWSCLYRHGAQIKLKRAAWSDARGQLAYNLACVYSLFGRTTDAVAQLVAQHFPNPIPTDTHANQGT